VAEQDHADFYRVDMTAFARVGGVEVEIESAFIEYKLDKVPTMTMKLTVGRDPETGIASKAFDNIRNARAYVPVEVIFKGDVGDTGDSPRSTPGFPPGVNVRIFLGELVGIGYTSGRQQHGGSAALTVEARGWLGALDGTVNQIKSVIAKGGPARFRDIANMNVGDSNFNALYDINTAVLLANTDMDLWQEFMLPFFKSIANEPEVWGDSPNLSAINALNRMSLAPLPEHRLRFEVSSEPQLFANWVAAHVGQRAFQLWRHSSNTVWSTLLSMGRDFGYRIVPLVETAAPAPIIGQLGPFGGSFAFKTIEPDEYQQFKIQAPATTLVGRVVLIGGPFMQTDNRSATQKKIKVLGFADASGVFGSGAGDELIKADTYIRRAPSWLEGGFTDGAYASETTGVKNPDQYPDAMNPEGGQEPEREPSIDYNAIHNTEIGTRYAKAIAMDMLLGPRRGILSGRFRLDIAPGSTIGIKTFGERFTKSPGEELYGLVESVQLHIGTTGGQGFAETKFMVTNLRNKNEHSDAPPGGPTDPATGFTVPAHPVYNIRYEGSPLVDF
jgi:hypothetical protein